VPLGFLFLWGHQVFPKYRASVGYHPLEQGVTLLASRSHPKSASATAAYWSRRRTDVAFGLLSRPIISVAHRMTMVSLLINCGLFFSRQ